MAEIADIQKLKVIDTTEIDQELVRFRKGYYRNNFRLLAALALVLGIINVALIVLVFNLYLIQPKVPQEFYTSNLYNGEVTKIYSLAQPLIKSSGLTQWAQDVVITSFTFNFVNYQDVFKDIKKYYTSVGWDFFSDSLDKSRIIDTLTMSKFFLSAVPAGKAVILDDGVVRGFHAWQVQIPMLLHFKASENDVTPKIQQKIMVNAIIIRVPDVENPENIAIDKISIS